jgi:hypothetical protein
MSETNPDPAEPTENQPGGSTSSQSDSESAPTAEPTENQPGGGQ